MLSPLEPRLIGKRVILVTMHRRENMDGGMASIARAVARIAERPDVVILFPMHPNPAVRAAADPVLRDRTNVLRTAALDYPSFIRALQLAEIVLTDSGGVQEEAPALGKPVLVLRETTERPEGVAAGTARLIGTDEERIVHETFRLLDDRQARIAMARAHNPFGDGRASGRIAHIVANAA